jgi:hypothetical protein
MDNRWNPGRDPYLLAFGIDFLACNFVHQETELLLEYLIWTFEQCRTVGNNYFITAFLFETSTVPPLPLMMLSILLSLFPFSQKIILW